MSFELPAIQKLCQDDCQRWCYIPTSLPQEQAAKTNMVSVVRFQVFSIITVEEGVANTCMEPKKSPFPRLATGLWVSNAWIQLKIVQYWWWCWRQWCRDVASGTDRHLDITFGLQVVESSSLVSVLFREASNHPFNSFFHLQVTGFSVIREYGSTLYVGLTRAVSPTNTNFRLTFLLTRLLEALYEDLAV